MRSETCWEPDRELTQAEDQIAAVANEEKGRGELFFSRPGTGATVSFSFPAVETGDAAEVLLDNGLDQQLQFSEDGFVGKLGEAHRAIAERHATKYVQPIADPSLVARMRIPVEYDEQTLVESLEALDAIAVETERLHDELNATLADRIE